MSALSDMAETLLGVRKLPGLARTTARRGELRIRILRALKSGPMTAAECYLESGWDSRASFCSRLGKLVADGEVVSMPGYPYRYKLSAEQSANPRSDG